jgi:DNA-binding IscR family transcriptional regulator
LKKLAARGVLHSVKGPFGGFAITEQTLQTKLIDLLDMIDGLDFFQTCMLQLGECNAENPCPLHVHVQSIKAKMQKVLTETNLVALMNGDNDMLVKSIITQKSNALNS